jgi:hypothetical protein
MSSNNMNNGNNTNLAALANAATAVPAASTATATASASAVAADTSAKPKKDKQKEYRDLFEKIMGDYKTVDDIVTVAEGGEHVHVSTVPTHGKSALLSIAGTSIVGIPKRTLEMICGHLAITGTRGANKMKLCDLLCAFKVNKPLMDKTTTAAEAAGSSYIRPQEDGEQGIPKGGTQEQQTSQWFRLINIAFHPTIKPLYARYKQQPNKQTLDAGKKHNQELFEKVLAMYNGKNPAEDDDDAHTVEEDDHDIDFFLMESPFLDTRGIDPSVFIPSTSWKSIAAMFQRLHKDYQEVLLMWKRSGEHRGLEDVLAGVNKDVFTATDEESRFTIKDKKILYFSLFLSKLQCVFLFFEFSLMLFSSVAEKNPGVFNTISAALPKGAQRSSTMPRESIKDAKRASSSNKKKQSQSTKSSARSSGKQKNEEDIQALGEQFETFNTTYNASARNSQMLAIQKTLKTLEDRITSKEKSVKKKKGEVEALRKQYGVIKAESKKKNVSNSQASGYTDDSFMEKPQETLDRMKCEGKKLEKAIANEEAEIASLQGELQKMKERQATASPTKAAPSKKQVGITHSKKTSHRKKEAETKTTIQNNKEAPAQRKKRDDNDEDEDDDDSEYVKSHTSHHEDNNNNNSDQDAVSVTSKSTTTEVLAERIEKSQQAITGQKRKRKSSTS